MAGTSVPSAGKACGKSQAPPQASATDAADPDVTIARLERERERSPDTWSSAQQEELADAVLERANRVKVRDPNVVSALDAAVAECLRLRAELGPACTVRQQSKIAQAYFWRGEMKYLGACQGAFDARAVKEALLDYDLAISILEQIFESDDVEWGTMTLLPGAYFRRASCGDDPDLKMRYLNKAFALWDRLDVQAKFGGVVGFRNMPGAPTRPLAYALRGSLKEQSGDYNGAIADCNRGLELLKELGDEQTELRSVLKGNIINCERKGAIAEAKMVGSKIGSTISGWFSKKS